MNENEDRARFVHSDLHLAFLTPGEGAVFQDQDQAPDRIRLTVTSARWEQWGRPVSLELTVDTEQDA